MTARWALTAVRLKKGNLGSRCSDRGRWMLREGVQHTAVSVTRSHTWWQGSHWRCLNPLRRFQNPGILHPVDSVWGVSCKALASGSLLLLMGYWNRTIQKGKPHDIVCGGKETLLAVPSTRWHLGSGVPGNVLPHPGPDASLWAWPSCFPSQGFAGLKHQLSGAWIPRALGQDALQTRSLGAFVIK